MSISCPEGAADWRCRHSTHGRIILIGNYEKQLTDAKKKASFELLRTSLADIDVVTLDEFFKEIEHPAKLFNLVRQAAK